MENIKALVFMVQLPQLKNHISFHQVVTDSTLDAILKRKDCVFDHWYCSEWRGRGKEKKKKTET